MIYAVNNEHNFGDTVTSFLPFNYDKPRQGTTTFQGITTPPLMISVPDIPLSELG